MNEQSTLPKRTYKKKEKKTPIVRAREKLQEVQEANNKAMWDELLAEKFDLSKCLDYFEKADALQKLRDYIALNKYPSDLK